MGGGGHSRQRKPQEQSYGSEEIQVVSGRSYMKYKG